MDYETFAAAYRAAFRSMLKYTVDQIGSSHFAGIMAELADSVPAEWVERCENEDT